MRVGIISDTHKKVGRAKKAIDLLKENKCEWIIHAGDVVKVEVLDYLEEVYKDRYIAVFGNNDFHLYSVADKYNIHSEPYYFKLANLTWKLMHYPRYMFPLDTDIIVYGHTHDVDITFNGKNLILNSGEVCARDHGFSSCMMLDINEHSFIVTLFYRKIGENEWKENIKEFYVGKNS